jgi:hypothetical protein
MGMAYDAARREVVLFAGGGGGLSDTWTWDGSTWNEQHPSSSPPFRASPSLAYDAVAKVVVLFGGQQGIEDVKYLHDTWTWDGITWTKQHPTDFPSGRSAVGLAALPARHQVVQFGGTNVMGPLRGTGTWDGTNWTGQIQALSPSARYSQGMAYDRATRQVLLFGGYGPLPEGFSGALGDTWTWDGEDWTMH